MDPNESIKTITIIICKFCGQVQNTVQHGCTNSFETNRVKFSYDNDNIKILN